MALNGASIEARPPAWRNRNAHLRFWLVAILGLVVDLWSKSWAFAAIGAAEARHVLPGVLEFRRSLNPGAVFGLGAGLVALFIAASALALAFVLFLFFGSEARQRGLHLALAMILSGALGNLYDRAFIKADVVVWLAAAGGLRTDIGVVRHDAPEQMMSLGEWPDGEDPRLIPAAAVVSRRRQGVVRDFIKIVPDFPAWVPWIGGRNVWPWVFNVADSLLVAGVLLLMLHFWQSREKPGARQHAATSAVPGRGAEVGEQAGTTAGP